MPFRPCYLLVKLRCYNCRYEVRRFQANEENDGLNSSSYKFVDANRARVWAIQLQIQRTQCRQCSRVPASLRPGVEVNDNAPGPYRI